MALALNQLNGIYVYVARVFLIITTILSHYSISTHCVCLYLNEGFIALKFFQSQLITICIAFFECEIPMK